MFSLYPINSEKSKHMQFSIMYDTEKPQILTFEMLQQL